MAKKPEGGRSFQEFLKAAPSLDEAANDDSVELTGLVSRTTDGRFAITTDGGQTYELDVEAVRDFREVEVPGATSAAAIRVGRDVLAKAVIRPVKPTIKDMIKDPIKDIIHDGKQMITDPLVDKQFPKDLHTDPPKDLPKDPLTDPHTFVPEGVGTFAADPVGSELGMGPVVNPAAPFVMATPHQAPAHLLQMQAGALPGAQAQTRKEMAADEVKRAPLDTQKELVVDTQKEMTIDTQKEMIADTRKEMTVDTQKEMIADTHKELIQDTWKEVTWDTLVEGGPNTLQEGVFDPGQVFNTQPGFGPGI